MHRNIPPSNVWQHVTKRLKSLLACSCGLIFMISFWHSSGLEVWGQELIVEDGFSDGNFTTDPQWTGDSADFTVITRESNQLLQLDASQYDGTSYLTTSIPKTIGKWLIYTEFGFAPSSYNRADIFLASETPNLFDNPTGYAIQVGERGSEDTFKLVYYDNGKIQKTLIQDTLNISRGGGYTLVVEHRSDGRWIMSTGRNYAEGIQQSSQTPVHTSEKSLAFFGVRTFYSETRSDKFLFDFKLDLPPPKITSIRMNPENTVNVFFNRPVDSSKTRSLSQFEVSSVGHPIQIEWTSNQMVRLIYEENFTSGSYQLEVTDLALQFQNDTFSGIQKSFFQFDQMAPGKVVINEFMPAPSSDLPEYVELLNHSSRIFNAASWKFGDAHQINSLSKHANLPLKSHAYLVITPDTTKLTDQFGPGPYHQVDDWASLNNGGDQLRLIDTNENLIDAVSYKADWGTDHKSVERRSADAPSRLRNNWGPTLNHRGSPGRPNTRLPEKTPPTLTQITTQSPDLIYFRFSEPINTSNLKETLHLSASDISKEIPWQFPDTLKSIEELLPISVTQPFTTGQQYTVEIDSVSDAYGNQSSTFDTSFVYYPTASADSGAVFITEFMYDPPASYPEYIELYNASEHAVDLSDLHIVDNTGNKIPVAITSKQLNPNTYIVLSPETLKGVSKHDHALIPDFPTLNNNGDAIVLYGPDETVLDSLYYIPIWGGSERSLERRSVHTPSTYISNWSPYNGSAMGSPARENRAKPDTVAPKLERSEVLHNRALRLYFSEPIQPPSLDISQYLNASPELHAQKSFTKDSTLIILLGQSLEQEVPYNLTLQHLSDPFDNTMLDTTLTLRHIPTERAQPRDIIINEFQLNDGSVPPFIELLNPSEKTIDLREWEINNGSEKMTLSSTRRQQSVIHPNQYIVLTSSSEFGSDLIAGKDNYLSFSSNGDDIVLKNSFGQTIDSLRYGKNWLPSSNHSLERKDPFAPTDDKSNWRTHSTNQRHSAGLMNSVYTPDTTPPVLHYAFVRDSNQIHLSFNENVYPNSDTQFSLKNLTPSVDSTIHLPNNQLILQTDNSLFPARDQYIEISRLPDFKGNRSSHVSKKQVAYPPRPGDLIFTEVLFDPLRDPHDGRPDQTEYVEFYNTRSYPLQLDNVSLRGPVDEKGRKTFKEIANGSHEIGGKQYGVIFADTARNLHKSLILSFYSLSLPFPYLRIDARTLSLKKKQDSLFLTGPAGRDLATLFYKNSWHTHHLADTKGTALEKASLQSSPFEPTSWGSSAAQLGGTPSEKNSIHLNYEAPGNSTLALAPNPFSPDGDGFEDHLSINYRFEAPDHLLDVLIFDRHGRLVRTLTEDKLAGTGGELIWNGMDNKGRPCRIGPYIILIEVYNPRTKRHARYKETAVLARKL